jgi:hypothetical protein
LAVLDVAIATPPGAKAPAALPETQTYPLDADTWGNNQLVLVASFDPGRRSQRLAVLNVAKVLADLFWDYIGSFVLSVKISINLCPIKDFQSFAQRELT